MDNNHIDINNRNITQWVERFLDGNTTCAEERELYRYFSRRELPAEVEQYREMFSWYATLGGAETANVTPKTENKVRILRLRPWQWVSVAASIAILLAIGFIFRPAASPALSDEYLAYEGSYIIRDGKKITDLSIVVPEILRQEQILNERIAAIEQSFDRADNAMTQSVESRVDISNPGIREAVKTALEY